VSDPDTAWLRGLHGKFGAVVQSVTTYTYLMHDLREYLDLRFCLTIGKK
jgi:hypothetical protein